jgi:ubiquinone/menaquinone biosynthesis C-methylase UbiE
MTKAAGVTPRAIQQWYQANARRYDRLHPGLPGDVEYYAGLARGRRVLEIGAGTGRVTAALAEVAQSVVALDNAPAMLAIARQRLTASVFTSALLLSDARALPVSGPFDLAVLAYRSLQHIDHDDRPVLLRALRCLLAPGGVLAFDTWHGHISRSPRLGPVIMPVTDARLRAELAGAGFTTVHVAGGFRGEVCDHAAVRVWQATY